MKITQSKLNKLSEMWFVSDLKNSKPNLVLNCIKQNNCTYFIIGTYSYNSITGMQHVEPLPGMEKLSHSEVINLLK